MTRHAFFQELFSMMESYYRNKILQLDREEIIEGLGHLSTNQVTKVFHHIIKKRPENAIYTPTPSHFLRISAQLYPVNTKNSQDSQIIYDDCSKCYSTGTISCCYIDVNHDNEDNYNNYFLCDCNNTSKIYPEHAKEMKVWNNSYLKVYLPINRLIRNKFNNDYKLFTESLKKKLLDFNQERINKEKLFPTQHTYTTTNIMNFTNFKPITLNFDEKNFSYLKEKKIIEN